MQRQVVPEMQFQLTQNKNFPQVLLLPEMILSLQELERLSEGKQSDEPGHCHYPPVHNGGKINSDVLPYNSPILQA